ncbi:NlpC/P60 family protein [Burkholderia alba]|uniref:NlpC/P60 family protein n=1 Tax=Burkholderia alba TaxID=2683677 RepID=UPI002B05953F|nr:NlpC/P60 family protein [Burkholderia alba]
MLRIWLSLVVVSLLAACSSVPQKTARSSGGGMSIATPRAFPPPRGFPNFVDHSVGREEISIQAMSLVGVPYRWGGNTPESGFDCSGLVRYVVGRAADVTLPRTTADMSSRGDAIEPDGVAPGDLIFFNTTGRPHSHVGIYVGKLRFVNAPSTGGTVRLDYLTNPYWAKRFDGIRRVAAPKGKAAPFDTPTYEASRPPEPAQTPAPRVTQTPQPAYAAAPAVVVPAAAPAPAAVAQSAPPLRTAPVAAAQADPFEPPPSAMSAAQQQARAAGAVAPALAVTPPTTPAETRLPAGTVTTAAAPDPIDSAADAFEPPPPTANAAARQAQLATPGSVQILRASTAPRAPSPAASGTSDDPIARFATGTY